MRLQKKKKNYSLTETSQDGEALSKQKEQSLGEEEREMSSWGFSTLFQRTNGNV